MAPALVGKLLVHHLENGSVLTLRITETEAYNGAADTACHAAKGKTPRTELLWREPGTIYIYLCYGMHWMLNAVTGAEGDPQAVLIRACDAAHGPGRLTKQLRIDKHLNGDSFVSSPELWIEDDGYKPLLCTETRVGIGYASEEDQARQWRFIDAGSRIF